VDSFDLNVGQLDLFSLNPELLPPAFLEENLDSLVLVLASFTALSFNCIKLESVHDWDTPIYIILFEALKTVKILFVNTSTVFVLISHGDLC